MKYLQSDLFNSAGNSTNKEIKEFQNKDFQKEKQDKLEKSFQIAVPITASELISSQYVSEEGWAPSILRLSNSQEAARLSIIGIVVALQEDFAVLDDGTGAVKIRNVPDNVSVGDVVHIIGRPRQYDSTRHITAEIVKVIGDSRWMLVRRKQIALLRQRISSEIQQIHKIQKVQNPKNSEKHADNTEPRKISDEEADNYTVVLDMVRNFDKGNGASVLDIINEIEGAEEIIDNLLKTGEIFELRKGFVKVLE